MKATPLVKFLLVTTFLLVLPTTSHAFGNDTFFLDFDYSLQGVKWRINQDNKDPALKYKTAGLAMMRLGGSLGFDQEEILSYHIERPFQNNPQQQEMLANNSSTSAGFGKSVGIFNLAPLVTLLLPEESLTTVLIRKALSIRVKETRELYFNEATALTNVIFLPKSAVFDYDQHTVSGYQNIPAGESLSSRSRVTEREITIPIGSTNFPYYINNELVKVSRHDLRLGYFQREWNRPSDTSALTVTSKPVVYEASYRAEGFVISFEPADPGSAGINFDISFKRGLNNSIQSPIDWEKISHKKIDYNFTVASLGLWYNFYLEPSQKGWSVTLGGNWAKTAMNIDVYPDPEQTNTKTMVHDDDRFTRYYLRTAYRF